MSIIASDIRVYGSAVMPEDDTTTAIGGAIDTSVKIDFSDISASGALRIVSSSLSDTTQNLTITGRNPVGEIVTETKQLNGTTPVTFDTTWERILKAHLDVTCVGTVTISAVTGGATLITMEPGIATVRRPFYNAAAPLTDTRDYYEKIFFKNTHASLTLTEATIGELSDPSGKITFGIESGLDGSGTNGTGNNRLVAPAGITFDSADKFVSNSKNHSSGKAQGVWLKLSLSSTDISTKTTYTLREIGITV